MVTLPHRDSQPAQFAAGDYVHKHGIRVHRVPWETGWNSLSSHWRCWAGLPLSLVNRGFTYFLVLNPEVLKQGSINTAFCQKKGRFPRARNRLGRRVYKELDEVESKGCATAKD